MRHFLIADLHLTDSKFNDIKKTIDFILDAAKTHKPNKIIFLGDFFDYADQHTYIQDAALSFIHDLSLFTEEIHFIVGNHDASELYNHSKHGCVIFKYLPNVIVHDPSKIEYDYINGTLYLYVPYFKPAHVDKFVAQAEQIVNHYNNVNNVIVYGHFEQDQAIITEFSERFDNIFSGHIHFPYIDNNIQYIGAVRYIDFKDTSETAHGITTLTISEDEITTSLIENTATPIYIKLDNINEIPIKLQIDREYYVSTNSIAIKEYLQSNYTNILDITVRDETTPESLLTEKLTDKEKEIVDTITSNITLDEQILKKLIFSLLENDSSVDKMLLNVYLSKLNNLLNKED